MAQVKLKNSAVTGKAPLVTDLAYGELALNYADGILYYKKSDNTIQSIGGAGAITGGTTRAVEEFTATSGQTTFTIAGGYVVGYIDVYKNGVYLDASAYTASNTTTVVLTTPAIAGDLLRFITYTAVNLVTNAYTTGQTDALLATKTTQNAAKSTTIDAVTSTYTIIASDLGKVKNCTSGTFTISLTSAATLGNQFNCYIKNSGNGVITIDPASSETIDGLATLTLTSNEAAYIVSNGTNWYTVGKVQTIPTQIPFKNNDSISLLAIGTDASNSTTTGQSTIAIGKNAGSANVIGQDLLAIGHNALDAATGFLIAGTNYVTSVAIGTNSLGAQTTGYDNVAVGHHSLPDISTGNNNVAIGYASGPGNSSYSVFVGRSAGLVNNSQSNNIVIGYNSTQSSSTASNEITLGNSSITTFRVPGLGINWTSTTMPIKLLGITSIESDTGAGAGGNTFLGDQAGGASPITFYKTFIGQQAGYASSNSRLGVGIGNFALQNAVGYTSGAYKYLRSVAVGISALRFNTTAGSNTAVGDQALSSGITGDYNIAVGRSAGVFNYGSDNVFLGYSSGSDNIDGSNNIIIGSNAQTTGSNTSNEIVIGNGSITRLRIPGLGINWTTATVPAAPAALTTALRAITTTASSAVLTTDGAAVSANNQVIIAQNSGYTFCIYIHALQKISDGTNIAAWKLEGTVRRASSLDSVTINSSTTVFTNIPGWGIQLGSDTGYGSLSIIVTGAVSTNISWSATVELIGSTYA